MLIVNHQHAVTRLIRQQADHALCRRRLAGAGSGGQRQSTLKAAALALPAANFDISAHGANEVAAERQPEAAAFRRAAAALALKEGLKKLLQFLSGNAITGIGDDKRSLAITPIGLDAH